MARWEEDPPAQRDRAARRVDHRAGRVQDEPHLVGEWSLEAGIDGTIKIRDGTAGELTNRIVRVQSKAMTKPFLNETADRF